MSQPQQSKYQTVEGVLQILVCWFCGKNANAVKRLILGPMNIGICDECVAVCDEILAENVEK